MDYTVRTASAADIAALTTLEAACFDDPWSEASLASHLSSPSGYAYLAVGADGTPLGYILGLHLGEEAELLRIGVLPEHRILGIGWKLVDQLLFELLYRSVKVCYLEVRESNYAALELYESHGFEQIGVRKNYYKNPTENAILMAYRFKNR